MLISFPVSFTYQSQIESNITFAFILNKLAQNNKLTDIKR